MSHTILYRTMFVKVSNERYIPLYESGSNNCYDILWNGRMRRERSWGHYYPDNLRGSHKLLPFYIEQELICLMESDVEQAMYCGTCICGKPNAGRNDLINYWRRGIKRAKTFEELKAAGIQLVVKDMNYGPEAPHYSCNVESEEDLIKAWKECMEKCGSAECMPSNDDVSEWAYKRLYPPQRKMAKEHNAGWVVTLNGRYVAKVSPRRFWFGYGLDSAHIYPQRATAEKLQQRIQRASYTSEVHPVRKNENGRWELAA